MNLVIVSLLIANVTLTSYRSVTNQTDDSPYITSIGERVSPRGCAVSRDFLKRWGGELDYGDLIYIEGVGFRFINDCMAARHKKAVDIWVATYEEEKKINVRKNIKIWLVKKGESND